MPNARTITFPEDEQEEIAVLIDGVFEGAPCGPYRRLKWVAIAQMALGKAEMLMQGMYDGQGLDAVDEVSMVARLQHVAATILTEFKPGDGKT